MGWYNGSPSDLNNLLPTNAAIKYVEYIGGEEAVFTSLFVEATVAVFYSAFKEGNRTFFHTELLVGFNFY